MMGTPSRFSDVFSDITGGYLLACIRFTPAAAAVDSPRVLTSTHKVSDHALMQVILCSGAPWYIMVRYLRTCIQSLKLQAQ